MNYDPNNPNTWGGQPYPGQQPGQPAQQPMQQPMLQPGMQQPGMPVPGYMPPPTQVAPTFPPQQVMQQPVQQAQPPMQLPQTHAVDESMVNQAYTQHKTEVASWGGDKPQYLSFPGPQGQKRWDSTVPVGYEATVPVYVAPPWAAGVNIFHVNRSHFWKSQSKPQGQACTCTSGNCLICKAREAAINQGDETLRERAKEVARARTRFLYNVFVLDNLPAHYDANGAMRPFILQAGAKMHAAIGDMVEARGGAIPIVDPVQGRPLRLKKKKVGPLEQNVEYSLVDLDPSPLPQEFYPALNNLWALSDMEKMPTQADMIAAVMDMGLPMPADAATPQGAPQGAPQGMPQPQPAYANPYQPQMQQQQQPTQQPVQQQMQQPVQQPVQQQLIQNAAGGHSGTNPPVQRFGEQPVQQQAQQPAQMSMQPPAVQSTGVQSQYSPQPSQPASNAAQPAQAVPATAAGHPMGNMPPPPDTSQPPTMQQPAQQPVTQEQARADGRDKCFGKHDPNSNICNTCPSDLKPQCLAQSGQVAQAPAQGQTVEQLQGQLQGK